MTQRVISKSDFFGIFYIKKPNGIKWDVYYRTIDVLRPLFQDAEFTEVVNGFYLNICGDFDSVRVSYFVDKTNVNIAISKFEQFIHENGLIKIKEQETPKKIILAKAYGGKAFEERFRNFLVLETQIGLDLIQKDLLNARRLFAIYRWQIRKASLSFREYFEPMFKRNSPTYNSLSNHEKNQLFKDLEEWPNPPQVDWAHMMVNFVLGCDWIQVFSDPNYLTPGQPLPITEINKRTRELRFQIPLDWKP